MTCSVRLPIDPLTQLDESITDFFFTKALRCGGAGSGRGEGRSKGAQHHFFRRRAWRSGLFCCRILSGSAQRVTSQLQDSAGKDSQQRRTVLMPNTMTRIPLGNMNGTRADEYLNTRRMNWRDAAPWRKAWSRYPVGRQIRQVTRNENESWEDGILHEMHVTKSSR